MKTLVDEINPVITEKHEFEKKNYCNYEHFGILQ